MSFKQEQISLETRMNTQWALLNPTIPVIYDNSPVSPPASGSWVRFRIYDSDARIAGIGGSQTLHRISGYIEIVVSVDKDTGTATARDLADDAAGIFRDCNSLSGFRFRSPWPQRLGVQDGWYRYAVTIPFERDESF